ncbi:MAG: hypothetical protein GY851_06015 [bacterium]|nr:hypothetical protein [bacterium]
MFEQINEVGKNLQNEKAGWVTRRDAAETLGKIASAALSVLNDHRDEMDVDVRRGVEEALGHASAALAGVAPKARETAFSLADLARMCEKKDRRVVKPSGDGFVVDVTLKSGRGQAVFISPLKQKDGTELIRVFTYCGKVCPDSMKWALRANMKLSQGALAIDKAEGEERFVLLNCFIASEVTPMELKASVKEIAYYGDWMEHKLTGMDDF